MDVQWTLQVEGLGRIERAEVRIHPFMLFVGENNSGKSYLASLLWGLVSLGVDIFPSEVPTSDAYTRCREWFQETFRQHYESPAGYELDVDEYELVSDWVNEVLAQRKDLLASRIFNVPEMKVASLKLRDIQRNKPLVLRFRSPKPGMSLEEHDRNSISLAFPLDFVESPGGCYLMIRLLARRMVMGDLALGPSLYLPASRTGFVLLHKFVVRQLIEGLLESERTESRSHLTRPAIRFLQELAGMPPGEGSFREEAAFLERGALQGRVTLEPELGVNEFKYHPGEGSPPLSMALSSSLVTELTPIILFLRHIRNPRLLVLEEPEAHLHPRVQRLLAQTLVRLVRKGLPVWVTTHSENFCQQINNFLKLSQQPDRVEVARELGYGEQDYLEPSEVVGFQFVSQGATSAVTELAKSASGFTMPTFNDELMALSQETLLLQRGAAKSG